MNYGTTKQTVCIEEREVIDGVLLYKRDRSQLWQAFWSFGAAVTNRTVFDPAVRPDIPSDGDRIAQDGGMGPNFSCRLQSTLMPGTSRVMRSALGVARLVFSGCRCSDSCSVNRSSSSSPKPSAAG